MAAIKAKHLAALAVTEPTATAQAAAARDADAGQAADAAPQPAGATPARSGVQETPERPSDQLATDRPGVVLVIDMHIYASLNSCSFGLQQCASAKSNDRTEKSYKAAHRAAGSENDV